jgi:peptide/nickel transport system substrate-binding protein
LVITLSQPHAPFLADLAAPSAAVQSKKRYEKIGAEAYRRDPMGTGPYYFAEWELNQLYVFKKNPYYHIEGKYAPSEYRFVVVLDDNTRVMQLQAGQVDVVRDLPQNRIDEIAAYPGLVVDTTLATEQRYVNFNVTMPPLDNPKVRRALRLATNKDEIIKMVLFGHGISAWNVFAKVFMYYDDSIEDPGYDPEKAKTMLAEAGYPDGFKTEMIYSSGNTVLENISTVLKEQWSKIGVDLQLNPMEGPTVSSYFQNLKHHVTLLRWSTDTTDPASFMSFVLNYDASHGFHTGWKNDRLTEISHKAESEIDSQKREALYHEIQKTLFDECPMYPLFRTVYPVARKETVHNFKFTGLGRYDIADAYKSE